MRQMKEIDLLTTPSACSYLNRYVYHDPLSDESIARYRRHIAFVRASGLIEETQNFAKHYKMTTNMCYIYDHMSCYWYGRRGRIPFVLTEPYTHKNYPVDGITYVQLPAEISPYGGGPFSTKPGLPMPTGSYLCVKNIHSKYLDEVSDRLIRAAEELPAWNSVSDDEREVAKLIQRKLNSLPRRWVK